MAFRYVKTFWSELQSQNHWLFIQRLNDINAVNYQTSLSYIIASCYIYNHFLA